MEGLPKDYDWYLDLDRTLLDTKKFLTAAFKVAGDVYGKQGVKTSRLWLEFPHQVSKLGGNACYDLFTHLKKHNIDTNEAKDLLREALKDGSFMYPDALEFLDWLDEKEVEPKILTFGYNDYQQLKIDSLPRLATIPATIVQMGKSEHLSATVNPDGKTPILVDDKDHNLPDWCVGILIKRGLSIRTPKFNGYVVSNLNEIKDLFDERE